MTHSRHTATCDYGAAAVQCGIASGFVALILWRLAVRAMVEGY